MSFRTWNVLVIGIALVCCAARPAGAQEQTGGIEGVIRDQQGALLPGVTVLTQNLAVGAVIDAVTDEHGRFRFPALAPGYYDVTAALDGFRSARFERVEILLGQIKRLDFSMSLAGVEETVVVSAASPLVDVKQSARGVSLRQDQLEHLPRSVDYTSVVRLLPGANSEPKLGGFSVDGASAAKTAS